jgi:hypothetical protein
MNTNIEEKFNNFTKIIENKEKMEFIKQINNLSEKSEDNKKMLILNQDNCSCDISSGYVSESDSNKISEINSDNKNSNNEKTQEKISIKSKHSSNNKDDDLSLLEDDFFICINDDNNNFDINFQNNKFDEQFSKTIKSEFENIFLINDNFSKTKKIEMNESSVIKEKLENIYNKIITRNNINNKNLVGYNIGNYIDLNETINIKTVDKNIKKISELVEFIFKESIRGWNHEQNLYILQIEKLKENLEKITCENILNQFRFGVIYRDFNESKVYLDKDFTKYWIGYNYELDNKNNLNKIIPVKYSIRNKILFYCLKNLTKSNKFKKKISKWSYKFIKKTVQIYGNKKLIVDIILFVGIKNIDD